MGSKLVIVESPAKARTLSRILSSDFVIKASLGHVRDLPRGELGIDIENGFAPKYVIPSQRRKITSELKKSVDDASAIYLATDPDREGEAISWHLLEAVKPKKGKVPVHRVAFHEITKEAVETAFRHPRVIDMNLVDAQQARRLLDRLVGYKLSPLLWRKVQKGLSAGRVQSAAVRIIVDREREIQDFVPVEYWTIEAELASKTPKSPKSGFRALLVGLTDGKKIEISNEREAEELKTELEKADYTVGTVQIKTVPRQPAPPFTTSTLQQEAWRRLRFTAKRTMVIAQQLYEGISIGEEGSVGLITYMRTDSTQVAASAIAETRDFINKKYGSNFLPAHARSFGKKGKWAQEAHEAIRPTKIYREPDSLRPYLKAEQIKLYELIWKRMVASQMSEALFDTATVEVKAKCPGSRNEYLLKATSSVVKFPGFMSIYSEGKDEDGGAEGKGEKEEKQKSHLLLKLKTGDELVLLGLFSEQYFTEPLPRYTEATLIKALEQKGIGRPSTYAPIISTIQEREYVHKVNGRFHPNEIGIIVNDLLTKHFSSIVDLSFTARMEKDLDRIAQGEKEWVSVLKRFYTPFDKTLNKALNTIEKIKIVQQTDETCPDCGKPIVIKTGRYGKFLACSGYPECKKTMRLVVKTGVPCPECGEKENGELVERISKKKRRFYGCSRYPKCRFTIRQRPVPQPCPQCNKLLVNYRNGLVKCTSCKYKGELVEQETGVGA